LNQSNINLNEVLKTSLEHEEPTASFEEVWDKYSKNKGPVLVYKRLSVLVAAVFVLLVSVKYISGMPGLSNAKDSSKNLVLSFSKAKGPSSNTNNDKTQNSPEIKSNRVATLFSEPAPSPNASIAAAAAAGGATAKVAKDTTAKQAAGTTAKVAAAAAKAKAAGATANAAKVAAESAAAAAAKVANIDNVDNGARFSKLQVNPTTMDAVILPKEYEKTMTTVNSVVTASFVIWDNRNYYTTTTLVDQKDLGKGLGETIKQTLNPQHNFEGNQIIAGTLLYEIKGEDVKLVIAVKVGEEYFRAVEKQ
jgi:hypothetical protein